MYLAYVIEDVGSTWSKKTAEERVSLVVSANATGTQKLPCTLNWKTQVSGLHQESGTACYVRQNKA